jgi:hypothetical protein
MNECAICEITSHDVRVGLVQWAVTGRFDSTPRCADRAACAERVWLAGKDWPVIEADHSPRNSPAGQATEPPPPPAPPVLQPDPTPARAPMVTDTPESWW